MARIKIELPHSFHFQCRIPVRITDINYGGHVGNDAVLSIIHEIRIQYLEQLGYSEMDFAGQGMIMTDVAIEFKGQLFYGDIVLASAAAGDISKIGFDIVYKLEKQTDDKTTLVARARTAMLCYDYKKKKIIQLPEEAKKKLQNG